MAAIEQALALTHLPRSLPEGYSRLYFGAEFCSWAFPPLQQVQQAVALVRRAGWSLTLMTPVLREESLAELETLFAALASQLQPGDELLLSDLGGLELARQQLPETPLVLGRALSGQKRGPRILQLELPEEAQEYFRQGRWYGREAVTLLQEEGIGRVELDNLLQGLAPLPAELKGTLHYPYAMVTSSRNCPFHPGDPRQRCSVNCGEPFRLSTSQTPVPLLQAGNSQFLHNDRLPEDLTALGIDRLVHHPQLPR